MKKSLSLSQKQRALKAIIEELRASNCPLRATATQPVAGEGNPNAEIFFIGEAPGRNEDEQGRPFVGSAGKILSALLESIGLTREEVFITSIEKFRPPKNREPKPEEIMACFPYLEKQITIIAPTLIVTLGRHALRRMLDWENALPKKFMIEDFRGEIFTGASGRHYYPIHHPAAVLYNPKLKEVLQKDFKKIPKLLQRLSKK